MSASGTSAAAPLVAVIDPMHPAGLARIGEMARVVYLPNEDPATHQAALAEAAAVVVRTFRMDDARLAAAKRLMLVVKHGAGTDNIDIPAASRRGVLVANTPGHASGTAVAEGAVALMLAVLRRMPQMDRLVREGRYQERWGLSLGDLSARRVGLVGFGRIARHVARMCRDGFGAEVAAHDPHVPPEEIAAAGVALAPTIAALAARSDILSLHAPLTPETRRMIDETVLDALPRGAIVVNTARGGLIDETALSRALRAGHLGGAGLDVLDPEPPAPDNPLLAMPGVVLSPHTAGLTEASLKAMSLDVAEVIARVLAGDCPETAINGDVWSSIAAGNTGTQQGKRP